MENKLKIIVICGSIREERMSIYPAKLIVEELKKMDVDAELVDLKKLKLPLYDGKSHNKNVDIWLKKNKDADGLVIVTPEYNNTFSSAIKNAIEYLDDEIEFKPVGLVGVSSGNFGGIRALMQLSPILRDFNAIDIPAQLYFPKVNELFNKNGKINDDILRRVKEFNEQMIWFTKALKSARN